MNDSPNNSRRVLLTATVAGLVFLTLVLLPTDTWVKREVRGWTDRFVFDVWRSGKVTWQGHELSVPRGRYNWTSDQQDIVFVTRGDGPKAVISLSVNDKSKFGAREFVAELCKEQERCAEVSDNRSTVGNRDVETVRYSTKSGVARYESYLSAAGKDFIFHVVADSESARTDGEGLAKELVAQLLSANR